MSYMRPIRVFTDLKSSNKVHRDFISGDKLSAADIQETVSLSATDRHIVVAGVGELTLPPDRFSVTVKCKSSKENFQDAKNSVTRRMDYIIQALKNNSLKETDYRIYQHTSHVESMVNIDTEVEAHFSDLIKCQSVCNFLAEKLGAGVSISLPCCYHARGSLDKLRRQAGMLAIHNARQKALEMARILHLSVGPALQVQELETVETHGTSAGYEEEPELNPSIQQRVAESTVSIVSKVFVCFQLKPAKHKKR